MRIIAKEILREFWIKHKDCDEQLKAWFQVLSNCELNNSNEIKSDYPSA